MSRCWCILWARARCQSHQTLKLMQVWSKWAQSQRFWFLAGKQINLHCKSVQILASTSPARRCWERLLWSRLSPQRSDQQQLCPGCCWENPTRKTASLWGTGWELPVTASGTMPSSSQCWLWSVICDLAVQTPVWSSKSTFSEGRITFPKSWLLGTRQTSYHPQQSH